MGTTMCCQEKSTPNQEILTITEDSDRLKSAKKGNQELMKMKEPPKKKDIKVVVNPEIKLITNAFVNKGDLVKFSVTGKWKFFEQTDLVDFNGHFNVPQYENFNIGCLLGRDGDEVFQVTDNSEHTYKYSGLVELYPNIGDYLITPSGFLEVTISQALEVNEEYPIEFFEKIEFQGLKLIEVDSSKGSQEYNIYVKKNEILSFRVKGFWSFVDNTLVDCEGHKERTEKNEGYNIGQLLCKIDTELYEIKDGTKFKASKSGIFTLFPNVGLYKLNPNGKLRVYLTGGIEYNNQKELEKLYESEIPSDAIKLEILPLNVDQSFSIWVEKGAKVKFFVRGRWKLAPSCDFIESIGDPNYPQNRGFNIGALLGRIVGEETSFVVKDNSEYTPTISSEIVFTLNNDNLDLETSGKFIVYIKNAQRKIRSDVNSLLGWDLNLLHTSKTTEYLSPEESNQFLILNKIRTNPPLFARQFLSHLKEDGGYTLETYEELMRTAPMSVIYPSKGMYLAAKEHAIDMGKSGLEGHLSTNGNNLAKRLEKYGQFLNCCGENCSYGHSNALKIVLQLLIDEGIESRGHRKNILNPEFKYAGISIQAHKKYKWNCVHDYAGGFKSNE